MGAKASKEDFSELAQQTRLDHGDLEDLLKTFKKLANKDGLVTKQELKEAIKKKYGAEDSSLLNALFNIFDKDGSKGVDFKEFALAYAYLTNSSIEDVAETSFRILDLNGDGFISKGEMRAVVLMNTKMKKYINIHKRSVPLDKVQITPAEVSTINTDADGMFARLDINGDGSVSKEEFIKIANSDLELKKKLGELLIKDESVNFLSELGKDKEKK